MTLTTALLSYVGRPHYCCWRQFPITSICRVNPIHLNNDEKEFEFAQKEDILLKISCHSFTPVSHSFSGSVVVLNLCSFKAFKLVDFILGWCFDQYPKLFQGNRFAYHQPVENWFISLNLKERPICVLGMASPLSVSQGSHITVGCPGSCQWLDGGFRNEAIFKRLQSNTFLLVRSGEVGLPHWGRGNWGLMVSFCTFSVKVTLPSAVQDACGWERVPLNEGFKQISFYPPLFLYISRSSVKVTCLWAVS